MKSITNRTVKSITRNALFISMILHVFLLIALFYFTVRNQSILSFQDKLDATIETVPKPPPSKKPVKAPIRQQRKATVFEAAKMSLAEVESIAPEITVQPRIAPVSLVVTEQPRLKQTNTAPDIKVNVSTALRELRQVEDGLSRTEAAQPTVGGSLGSKRSGPHGVQRTPIRSTLDIAGKISSDNPTQIDDLQDKKQPLPRIQFSNVMKSLANQIAETSDGGPIDVVFVIDASGSMGDNIKAVAKHLTEMIDVYKSSDIDYALGLTQFNTFQKENVIEVLQLTKNLSEYKQNILAIVPGKDENALDAIEETVNAMRFRATSKKHLILVTDEPFTSIKGLKVHDAIALCSEFGIHVNVLGLPKKEHQLLASKTKGKWHAIPEKPRKLRTAQRRSTNLTANAKAQWFRKAQWQDVQLIGKALLQNSGNSSVDIVLFIDGSKSMEDKIPQFLQQLDIWTRDWDNAHLNYQIGVVKFRKRGSVNTVNVYKPPQTLEQIHKIVELPCQDDENLLHAITEGLSRIKLRPDVQTHLILVTDEPVSKNAPTSAMIQYLMEKPAVVSVVGTFDDFQEEVAVKTGGIWVPIPDGYISNNSNW